MKGRIGTSTNMVGPKQLRDQAESINLGFSFPKKSGGSYDAHLRRHWPLMYSKIHKAWQNGDSVKSLNIRGDFKGIVTQCWKEWNALHSTIT